MAGQELYRGGIEFLPDNKYTLYPSENKLVMFGLSEIKHSI